MRQLNVPVVLSVLSVGQIALAGGGGLNVLLVVNPNDENAVRIAREYQSLRHIPDSNIVFITPPKYFGTDLTPWNVSNVDFVNYYTTPIANAISQRGLTDQIDYIATIGQPFRINQISGAVSQTQKNQSVGFGLTYLDLYNAGHDGVDLGGSLYSALYQSSAPVGTNTAIHHSTVYTQSIGGTDTSVQYYMTGVLANTGATGNSVEQVLANLERTVAGDGTKPEGTVHLIKTIAKQGTNPIPSETPNSMPRSWKFAAVAEGLSERGVSVNHETKDISAGTGQTATPQDAVDVRGVTTGAPKLVLPAGSTYTPGSYADSLTSYGMVLGGRSQTQASDWLAAGVAGTAGTVVEPYAIASKFTEATVHLFSADGSTLGEAYNKSIGWPVQSVFQGDMLSQAYADLPEVSINSGPANGQENVSGIVTIGATAALNNPTLATGIKRMELYIDGRLKQTTNGDLADFTLDTTTLSDGWHELRVVALNNAAAESQSLALRQFAVNNGGRSVTTNVNQLSVTANEQVSMMPTAVAGNGTPHRVELRYMGRTVAQTGVAPAVVVDTGSYSRNTLANQVNPAKNWSGAGHRNGAPNQFEIVDNSSDSVHPGQVIRVNRGTKAKPSAFVLSGDTGFTDTDLVSYSFRFRPTAESYWTMTGQLVTMSDADTQTADGPMFGVEKGQITYRASEGFSPAFSFASLASETNPAGNLYSIQKDHWYELTLQINGAVEHVANPAGTTGEGKLFIRDLTLDENPQQLQLQGIATGANYQLDTSATLSSNPSVWYSSIPVGLMGDRAISKFNGWMATQATAYGGLMADFKSELSPQPLTFNTSQLAYGENHLTPVAIYSDGQEVAGAPVTILRNPNVLAGASSSSVPAGMRTPGIKMEYFVGKAGNTISQTDLSGTPDRIGMFNRAWLANGTDAPDTVHNDFSVGNGVWLTFDDNVNMHPADLDYDHMAARLTGFFDIGEGSEGEYLFELYNTNDVARVLIDGISILDYGYFGYGTPSSRYDTSGHVFLGEGIHSLEVDVAKIMDGNQFDLLLLYRGPDGVFHVADDTFVFQIEGVSAVPEPACGALLGVASILLGRRRRSLGELERIN